MIENPNVVPIAVVVAVGIFVIKEALEAIRRFRERGRKLEAIRRLLAIECERNKFALSSLRNQVERAETARKEGAEISIVDQRTGPRLLVQNDGQGGFSSPIPKIQTATLERFLFEAASLDKGLFEQMEKATEQLLEALHVRDGLIYYITEDRQHLEGFDEYALKLLDDALGSIESLYFKCTTEPLSRGRVR